MAAPASPPPTSTSTRTKRITLRSQPGPQSIFQSTSADIALYGGSAGSGKTFALLFEPLRHIHNHRFGGVIFRRTAPEITAEGGLWDKSFDMYGLIGGTPFSSQYLWKFPSGSAISFGHIQHEKDLLKWHSSEIPFIGFDELTSFSERQFFYLMTRNRSTCGVLPYIRATTNPDADSWVAKLVAWWIDQTTGYPIPERSGVVRWFVRDGDALAWGSREKLLRQHPGSSPKSFTFVSAKLSDNQILERADPGYRANLEAQPTVDRERLLGGNWKIRIGGKYFDRSKVRLIPSVPTGTRVVRYWDTACLVAGTMIDTLRGPVPIERVTSSDHVLTRSGYCRVKWAGFTKFTNQLVKVRFGNGRDIVGTPEHKVWTINRGWAELGSLLPGDYNTSTEPGGLSWPLAEAESVPPTPNSWCTTGSLTRAAQGRVISRRTDGTNRESGTTPSLTIKPYGNTISAQ